MDCSQYVLSLIKDNKVRSSLNPILYYSLKYIYSPEFSKRSRFFCRAIKSFFTTLGTTLNINMSDNNDLMTLMLNQGDNSTSPLKESLAKLFSNDLDWFINLLLNSDNNYLLDQDEDYVLLHMLRMYIFSDEAPETSQLMLGYNLFVSSIELMFCLRLVMNFPKLHFHKKEAKISHKYTSLITNRVTTFCIKWCQIYPKKFNKTILMKELIKCSNEQSSIIQGTEHIDVNSLTLDEPILTMKYIGLVQLIREGPFLYELDEIVRQMCIIEHEYYCSISRKEVIQFIVKKEMPASFEKFYQREKQLQCYILIFLMLIKNLENKKNVIQNFISLACQCKKMHNYQTCYMIIAAFSKVTINKKTLLWRLVEKRYKEIYNSLEQEYLDIDLNEKTFFDQLPKEANLFIPHISLIRNQINNYIIQIKMCNEEQKVKVSKEFQNFCLRMEMFKKSKYPFFTVNPLYDFLNFGFLEMNKTKQWGLKSKFDFSAYSDTNADFGKLLDFLVKVYKKTN